MGSMCLIRLLVHVQCLWYSKMHEPTWQEDPSQLQDNAIVHLEGF